VDVKGDDGVLGQCWFHRRGPTRTAHRGWPHHQPVLTRKNVENGEFAGRIDGEPGATGAPGGRPGQQGVGAWHGAPLGINDGAGHAERARPHELDLEVTQFGTEGEADPRGLSIDECRGKVGHREPLGLSFGDRDATHVPSFRGDDVLGGLKAVEPESSLVIGLGALPGTCEAAPSPHHPGGVYVGAGDRPAELVQHAPLNRATSRQHDVGVVETLAFGNHDLLAGHFAGARTEGCAHILAAESARFGTESVRPGGYARQLEPPGKVRHHGSRAGGACEPHDRAPQRQPGISRRDDAADDGGPRSRRSRVPRGLRQPDDLALLGMNGRHGERQSENKGSDYPGGSHGGPPRKSGRPLRTPSASMKPSPLVSIPVHPPRAARAASPADRGGR
jgi:hypothetical protein